MGANVLPASRIRFAAWSPALAVVVGAAIRLITLPYKSLWLDEVVTLHIASGPVAEILAANADPHPPLYYLLMHFWIGLGQSEAFLRLPSVVAGIIAIPLLYEVVRLLSGHWTASVAAWLLALAPLHVWYSQETRMYALVCMLGLLSTLLFILAAHRGRTIAWIGWVPVMLAGLYVDYSMFFVLAGQAIFFPLCLKTRFGQARPSLAWPGLLALLIVLFLYEPQARRFLIPTIAGGEENWRYLYFLPASQLSNLGFPISPEQLRSLVTATGIVALVLALLVAFWLLPTQPWRSRHIQPYVAIAAIVVYLLILAASAVSRAWGVKRLFLVLLPYVLAACAAGLATQRKRRQLLLVLVAITLPFTIYALLGQEQEGWRSVARLIQSDAQTGDLIAFEAGYIQQSFDYYDQGTLERRGVAPADTQGELPRLAANHERVWLVLSAEQIVDPDAAVQSWFDQNMALKEAHAFGRVQVRLYAK